MLVLASPHWLGDISSGLAPLSPGCAPSRPLIESIFLATALPHFVLVGYTLLRISRRAPVPPEDREAFKTLPSERGITPEGARLDPRTPEEPAEPEEPAKVD